MWTFRLGLGLAFALDLALLHPGLVLAAGMDAVDNGMPAFDHGGLAGSDLRDAVDDYEDLLDDLAHETRSLDKPAHEALLKGLALDFRLGDQVEDMRRGLADNEAVLDIQDAIGAEQARLKAMPAQDPRQDREERTLLGLHSDLIAAVAGLRQRLAGELKGLDERHRRDLKDWLMVSAGLLRHRREDAEAAALAHPTPEAAPIDAASIRPAGLGQPAALSPAARP